MANKNDFDEGYLDKEALEKLGLMFSIGLKKPGVDFENIIQNLYELIDECEDFTQFERFEYKNALTMTVNLFYRYIDNRKVH